MKKQRGGTVENVLSFGITFWMLSGQPFEYQTKWKQVLPWNPNIAVLFKINQAETATSEPTYHLRIVLQILFYQAHLQGEREWLIVFRESIPRTRQSPPLLTSPRQPGWLHSVLSQCTKPLKPHKFVLSLQSLFVFFIEVRQGRMALWA